jgi:hypothetical protein
MSVKNYFRLVLVIALILLIAIPIFRGPIYDGAADSTPYKVAPAPTATPKPPSTFKPTTPKPVTPKPTAIPTPKPTAISTPKPKQEQGVWVDASRSTCFCNIVYYMESNTVEVCFRNSGKWYRYTEVPEYIIEEFINAPSLGRYYNQNIKGQYPCEKMS